MHEADVAGLVQRHAGRAGVLEVVGEEFVGAGEELAVLDGQGQGEGGVEGGHGFLLGLGPQAWACADSAVGSVWR